MRKRFACLFGIAGFAIAALPAAAVANPLIFNAASQIDPGGSPFGATSSGAACQQTPGQSGTNYPGTQVEPWLAVDPSNGNDMISVWQQDRWTNGGSNALLSAYTTNGGTTWTTPAIGAQPKFSNCTLGSGDTGGYNRASDPWVTISPNGDAYFMALQADIGVSSNNNAMSVSKSTDHGASWSTPTVLKRDTALDLLNDKNSITADRFDSHFVYAIWDRLVFPNANAAREAGDEAVGFRGPTWFARTTDGGATWEHARIIFDPGEVNQTIGNQIVQTGDGTLVNGFDLILNFKNSHEARGHSIAVLRSTDRGATWSGANIVSKFTPGSVTDPTTGHKARTGDIIPEIAADPRSGSQNVYMVWQERTSASSSIMLSKSTDDGATWSAPQLINQVSNVQAFNPSIRVGGDGTVTVTYNDFRNDTSAAPLVTDVWAVHSHDGGSTFSEDHVMGPFDMSGAANTIDGFGDPNYFTGDYDGLDTGTDPGNTQQFFEAGNSLADGTPASPSSHINASKGE